MTIGESIPSDTSVRARYYGAFIAVGLAGVLTSVGSAMLLSGASSPESCHKLDRHLVSPLQASKDKEDRSLLIDEPFGANGTSYSVRDNGNTIIMGRHETTDSNVDLGVFIGGRIVTRVQSETRVFDENSNSVTISINDAVQGTGIVATVTTCQPL